MNVSLATQASDPLAYEDRTVALSTAQASRRKTMMRGYQDLTPELQAQARDECLALLKPSRSALSATSHKKNNTEDPSNREADKHKLAQRRAARQFGCL